MDLKSCPDIPPTGQDSTLSILPSVKFGPRSVSAGKQGPLILSGLLLSCFVTLSSTATSTMEVMFPLAPFLCLSPRQFGGDSDKLIAISIIAERHRLDS